jgi:hypothetical protein
MFYFSSFQMLFKRMMHMNRVSEEVRWNMLARTIIRTFEGLLIAEQDSLDSWK